MGKYERCKKNRRIFDFWSPEASDIIAEGDWHMPDNFFDIWHAMVSQKLTFFTFLTAYKGLLSLLPCFQMPIARTAMEIEILAVQILKAGIKCWDRCFIAKIHNTIALVAN